MLFHVSLILKQPFPEGYDTDTLTSLDPTLNTMTLGLFSYSTTWHTVNSHCVWFQWHHNVWSVPGNDCRQGIDCKKMSKAKLLVQQWAPSKLLFSCKLHVSYIHTNCDCIIHYVDTGLDHFAQPGNKMPWSDIEESKKTGSHQAWAASALALSYDHWITTSPHNPL